MPLFSKTFRQIFLSFLLIFSLPFSQLFAHGMSDAEKSIATSGGMLDYIWLGITHMLTGYDHLAFVFGIIFFLTTFKQIAKYITAFTLGHSATLIFATLNKIQINHYLIDAIIALSVCYIGFYNLGGFKKWLNINPPNMLAMIFGLGLIHGFGLSTLLQQLPLNPDHILGNIISFNVGIELGQIAALALMLIALSFLRKTNIFPLFSKIINWLLIIAGLYLFFGQMQGYFNSQKPVQSISNETQSKNTLDWQDVVKVTVPPNNGIEYKLNMKKGATLTYSWTAEKGQKLYFDFHGEPKGDKSGYFKSYKEATLAKDEGTQEMPFEGTHGWYWKNVSGEPVTVILKLKGNYQKP